ncbi:hypothetical protein F5Y01DRAFT_314238 [Xylaria sp. FL0043]|nr:hypothetical protein F5Y01DRAFT_314238 [Xylaria sp. FL0043]
MHIKIFLITALIGAATAQLPAMPKRSPLESQTPQSTRGPSETDLAKCSSAVSAIETLAASAPTPPADLASLPLPIDPCAPPSLTGKLQSDWSSYTSAALQWYLSHTAEFENFFTACEDDTAVSVAGPIVCKSDLDAATATATATATTATTTTMTMPAASTSSGASDATASDATTSASNSTSSSSTLSSSSSSSTSSTSSTPNAAPRETGFVVAAAAVAAGFMGAVAVL